MARCAVLVAMVGAGTAFGGCVPQVDPGEYACSPDEPYACPSGWYCLPLWNAWRCYPSRGEDHCGDGIVQAGEQCDGTDFERAPGDVLGCRDYFTAQEVPVADATLVCTSDCRVRCAWCGNDVVDRYPEYGIMEECDSTANDQECNPNCTVPRCGDGFVQADPPYNEQCDDGNQRSGDGCSGDCLSQEVCGNGYVDFQRGEECDDGNFRSHDGCNSQCRTELPAWQRWVHPLSRGRTGHAVAFDTQRQRLVLFGGWDGIRYHDDTWEYDGVRWHHRSTSPSPPPRSGHGLAYDPVRQRVVLFGGHDSQGYFGDTWEWDGTTWTQTTSDHAPSARTGLSLVYDAGRQRVVLFGGADLHVMYDDTWLYGPGGWEQRPTDPTPPQRVGAAMTWDASRQKVVLYGGIIPALIYVDDTWELDAQGWTQVTTTTAPVARDSATLAFDAPRGRVVLYGGRRWTEILGDTWEYDGASWVPRSPTMNPPPLYEHAMAYDPVQQRVVLYGGHTDGAIEGRLWLYDGTGWTARDPQLLPPARVETALAFDEERGVTVLFGGMDHGGTLFDDTWEFDGSEWRQRDPAHHPSARTGHVMAYDSRRGVTVLFGGSEAPNTTNRLGDTWEWDGVDWVEVPVAEAPPTRGWAAMTDHVGRQRLVLFGGYSPVSKLDDTWEYDGLTWENKTRPIGSPRPPARSHHRLAYLAGADCVVLFGGVGMVNFDDTWVYVDTQWVQVDPGHHPPGRYGHVMVHESARDRVLIFGGAVLSGVAADTWELYGGADPDTLLWADLAPSAFPEPREGAAAAFDTWRQMAVLFGGVSQADTWTFAFRSSLADESCENGVDDDDDGRVDCADPDCEWMEPCTP